MLSKHGIEFTKDNIDLYLKELAKEYRKLVGKGMPAELILIGGASVLINYGFRNMTTDIDALIRASSGMKDAIDRVGERFNLPKAWLNSDFQKTRSYTPKLEEFSKYYKTYSNILTIRTVAAEYLIAMKLQSGRQYKSDLSDILGILTESENPRKYWSVFKVRLKKEGNELATICSQLKMKASDGKMRQTDVANMQGIFRIIQSVPSPKAEPFKMWLAEVGKERIDEIIDPELTIDRALETYAQKGYSREWINQRLQAIQVRKELTDTL